jgi:hypothetical protein
MRATAIALRHASVGGGGQLGLTDHAQERKRKMPVTPAKKYE